MKVLVTGGAGYIGSVLCEHLLDAGYDVTVLDNLMYGQTSLFHLASNPKFHFVYGNVVNYQPLQDLVTQSDIIIPLAAIVGAPACSNYLRRDVNDINTHLSGHLAGLKDKLVIYPNTNSGYGSTAPNEICTEDTPLTPISIYGESKRQAEEWLFRYHHDTIALRLATVFGMSSRMRIDLLVNDFVYKAVTDGYLVLFEPYFRRNFVHIRDVADCFIHCIENAEGMVGRAYNVGNDFLNTTKLNLANAIKEHIPTLEICISEYGSDPDKRDYIVSNQRLRDAGYVANTSLSQGIEELIKGYKMTPVGVYRNA